MITILAVIPSLTMGGAEKAFVVWVATLQEYGYKVVVFTSEEEADFFSLPAGTVRYFRRPPRRTTSSWLFGIKRLLARLIDPYLNALYLRKILSYVKPDLVISHLPKANVPAILASRIEKIPCIVMEHLYQKWLKDPVLGCLRAVLYPYARALVVLTPSMHELFRKFNKTICEIVNPIPSPSCEKIFPFELKEKVILLVGRLNKQKQFVHFVQQLSQFDLKDWTVWIVGEGKERRKLENLLETYSLGKQVHLLGAVKRMEEVYQRASLFVLCSQREGYSLVLAESALYGCVRLSFNCPCGPESLIKDQETGFLIENQNWTALFEKLKELMSDEGLRNRVYKQTLMRNLEFEPKKVIHAWETLIKEVVN